jgi:hypothetical protein
LSASFAPLERPARRAALLAIAATSVAALAGALVRLLPWLLDPAVTWRVAAPFARGVLALAFEAAILLGWPVGWALATAGLVERGEQRVLATLGERPERTVLRLLPQALMLASALAVVSFFGGRDASAPGRVVTELLAQARAACAEEHEPTVYAVPFTDATWLCRPDAPPRLVGHAPGGLSAVVFTATDAQVAGDLRSLELHDARLRFGHASVHVDVLRIGGLAPWAHGSNVPPALRAVVLGVSGAGAALLAAYLVLRRLVRRRFAAIAVGAAGPLVALGALRALERADARAPWAALVPVLAVGAAFACALLLACGARLRLPSVTASK